MSLLQLSLGCTLHRFTRVILLAIFLPAFAAAQPGTGVISGRVFNPATGEYVRNAEVGIAGGPSVATGDGGFYRISGVLPGEITLNVRYTGYHPVAAVVRIAAGETLTRDFELVSSTRQAGAAETVILESFVVSSEREGNAKAIMDQRQSMNITNTVASDVFGDVAEGNVGEFLKHIPGVDIEFAVGEARRIGLGGLPPEYTGVTLDGASMASADANTGADGSNSRAFSMEQVSLSSLDSIEVSKTVSADVDANAPAGTINLKTKRAFDRRGRRIVIQTNVTANSEEFHLDKTDGPDDYGIRKVFPGGILEYSDVFLNGRLGIVFSASESKVYNPYIITNDTYNFTPTAADPRPAVLTQISLFPGPRTNERFTSSLTADFKATNHLVLSMGLIYNFSEVLYIRRQGVFNFGARNTVVGDGELLSATATSPAAFVAMNRTSVSKVGHTKTILPRFEYKRENVTVEGRFSYSGSDSNYDNWSRRGNIFMLNSPRVSGVTFSAERSSRNTADWQITQLGGPDWADGANYSNPTMTFNDGRYARTQIYGGALDVTGKMMRPFPVTWKAGVKAQSEIRDFNVTRGLTNYRYTAKGTAIGPWAGLRSPYDHDVSLAGAQVTSLSGDSIFVPNVSAIAQLFRDQPQDFTHELTPANFYDATVANKRYYVEDIKAAYLMATASLRRTMVRAGLRTERTSFAAREFDPLSPAEVVAAGYPVAAGRATSIPGINYQYFTKPRITRKGDYTHLFPSASIKHNFTERLQLHAGYSRTIRRPSFKDVVGVWTVVDEVSRVSAPNPNLAPEESDNLSMRLAYYFEPVGALAFSVLERRVRGLHVEDELTASEFGYSGSPAGLEDYTFVTTQSSDAQVTLRSYEAEYSQSLSFLPQPLRGLNVRAAYTRNEADVARPNVTPQLASAGINYSLHRFNVYASLNWKDDTPTNVAGNTYRRHYVNVDGGGGYAIKPGLNVFFSVRNVFNEPMLLMRRLGDGSSVMTQFEAWGTAWTFGLKKVF